MKTFFNRSENGSTMLVTIIMSFMAFGVVMYVSSKQSLSAKAQNSSEFSGDKEVVRTYIQKGLDCKQTLAKMNSKCIPGDSIELVANSTLVPILVSRLSSQPVLPFIKN